MVTYSRRPQGSDGSPLHLSELADMVDRNRRAAHQPVPHRPAGYRWVETLPEAILADRSGLPGHTESAVLLHAQDAKDHLQLENGHVAVLQLGATQGLEKRA